MANYIYGAIALTGGGTGSLDSIDGSDLAQDDAAIVFTSTGQYVYNLDESSGGTENSPDLIAPDNNAGNKRWVLLSSRAADSAVDVSSFSGILDANDDDVQKALNTIDTLFNTDDFDITAGGVELSGDVVKNIGANTGAITGDTHNLQILGENNSRVQTIGSDATMTIVFSDYSISTKTSSYTIVKSDDIVIGDCAGGDLTFTLPDASTKAVIKVIKKSSSNTLTVDCYSTQTIEAQSSITMSAEYESNTFVSDGVNTWITM